MDQSSPILSSNGISNNSDPGYSNYGSTSHILPHANTSHDTISNNDASHDLTTANDKTSSRRWHFIGYCLVGIVNITDVSAVVTAQLALGKISIFEINIIRYAFQFLTGFTLLKLRGCALAIESKHWLMVVGVIVFDYTFGVGTYLAASFLPVGNTQGVSTSLYIVFTVAPDLVRGIAHRSSIICTIIACAGVLLLSQPWNFTDHPTSTNPCAACETLDGFYPTALNSSGQCVPSGYVEQTSYVYPTATVAYNTTDLYADMIQVQPNNHGRWDNQIVGYFLVAIAAIAAAISSNCSCELMKIYPLPTVVCWITGFDVLLSLTVTLIEKTATQSLWSLPSAQLCLVFGLLFAFTTGVNDLLWYFTFCLVPVSHVSLGSSPSVVLLYICQKTFLKQFYPGYSNYLEPIGAFLAFTGAALMPVFHLFLFKRNP